MTDVSGIYESLYRDAYLGGRERAWRDAGAIDKAENIRRAWAAAAISKKPVVVELGSGDGAIAARLAQSAFFEGYRGFDLSESGVAEARSRQIANTEFSAIATSEIPVDDDSADLVILSHVVEHLEHPRSLLYEARRIAPWTIVEVPLERTFRTPRDFVRDDLGHINLYDSTTIRHLVQSCDLEVIAQFTTQPGPASYFFHGASQRRRLAHRVKRLGVATVPSLARSLMVFHETLLTRRGNPVSGGAGLQIDERQP